MEKKTKNIAKIGKHSTHHARGRARRGKQCGLGGKSGENQPDYCYRYNRFYYSTTFLWTLGPTYTLHVHTYFAQKSTGVIWTNRLLIILIIIIIINNISSSIYFTGLEYFLTTWNPLRTVSAAGRMKGQKRADGTDGSGVTLQAIGLFPCYFM